MSRWWESGVLTVAHEQQAFRDAGLDFALDEPFLAEHEVVVFRGHLRRGERRASATIVYPPAYADGAHPQVFATDLPLNRHWRPEDGLLCLDHLHPGDDRPMNGPEAVGRAEELWRLLEEDPDRLAEVEVEVEAPDPVVDRYAHNPGSLVYAVGIDVEPHNEGWLRVDASTRPVRGQITGIGAGIPSGTELPIAAPGPALAGAVRLLGYWRRLDVPPPWTSLNDTLVWLRAEHSDLVDAAIALASGHRAIFKRARLALIGFVFPDEGPGRGETQDTWMLAAIDLTSGDASLVRVASIAREDTFVRQPTMAPLADRQVLLVGIGALGSPIADLLARAGVGALDLIDPELFEPGNVTRHELTLRDAGFPKADAVGARLITLNPFLEVRTSGLRVGTTAGTGFIEDAQRDHDRWSEAIAGVHLVINATASPIAGRWLARLGDRLRTPVLHAAVSAGAWGARIQIQRPGVSGCPECLALHQRDGHDFVPYWSEDPDGDAIVGRGCSQPTFAAPGFELAAAAAAAARSAVQELLDGEGYPAAGYDLATLRFRNAERAEPDTTYTRLPRHDDCELCSP